MARGAVPLEVKALVRAVVAGRIGPAIPIAARF